MKKIMLVAVILIITSLSMYAEKVVLIQGTYLSTSRVYNDYYVSGDSITETFNEIGLNVTSFRGKTLGFYFSRSYLIPYEWTIKEEEPGYADYEYNGDFSSEEIVLGLDLLLGLGCLVPIGKSSSLLMGTGVHYNGYFLPGEYETDMSNVLGAGIAANLIIDLSEKINFNISAMGAWDIYEIYNTYVDSASESQQNGYTFSISAGFGYSK